MSKEFSSREMKWIDIYDIAIALEEAFPEKDIMNIRFPDLQKLVLSLDGFNDDIKNCNERVLEAIQQAWIDER